MNNFGEDIHDATIVKFVKQEQREAGLQLHQVPDHANFSLMFVCF